MSILDDLKKIGKEMNAQDNRLTQFPLFVVQEKVRKYVSYSDDYECIERKSDFEFNDLCEACQELFEKGETLPETCEDCPTACFDYYNFEWEFDLKSGVFFTAKACEEHIAQNHYHYNTEVRSYAIGAWRNPEMQSVMQALSVFGSKKDNDTLDVSIAKACYKKYE